MISKHCTFYIPDSNLNMTNNFSTQHGFSGKTRNDNQEISWPNRNVVPYLSSPLPIVDLKIGMRGRTWNLPTFSKTNIAFVSTGLCGNVRMFFFHSKREINFEQSWSAKNGLLQFFLLLIFVNLVNFTLEKVHKFMKIKVQSL